MNLELTIINSTILIVDDNPTNLSLLSNYLIRLGFKILIKKNGKDGLELAIRKSPDLILLDIMMPELDGYETCKALKANEKTKEIPVIFMSALSETFDKIKGFEVGGVDYIIKPFQMEEVLVRVKTHLTLHKQKAALAHELRVSQELFQEVSFQTNGELLGKSTAIKNVHSMILEQAKTEEPLMLIGAIGSGEEAIARAIHKASKRSLKAFIYVNCTDFKTFSSMTLATSSGTNKITKDSTTSVSTQHQVDSDTVELGEKIFEKFQLAHEGTLYLERVDELSASDQRDLEAMIVKLEEESEKLLIHIRLITHITDHQKASGRFSQKLYKYLSKNILRVPSLLERREDIPVLAEYYLKRQANWLGKTVEGFSPRSLQRLEEHSWPGNLKELRNVVERAILLVSTGLVEIDEELLQQGVRIDRYRLIQKLGFGGMGEVWIAKHQMLARPAALKLIKEDFANIKNSTKIQRFQLEAQIIAELQSPHTVRLYDYGVTETGKLYYVMELLEGMDLESMIKHFGPFEPERVGYLLSQACRSLMEAHEYGVIHRDIKPPNLFISKQGPEYDFLKILDFGMVKQLSKEGESLTEEKKILGTPLCMAPERLGGGGGDARSDLYSLGCTAYWMLTGEYLFKKDNLMNLMMAHIFEIPPPLASKTPYPVPPLLEEIILKCLEKKEENRPSSAFEVWEELEKVKYENPWTCKRAELWWKKHLPDKIRKESNLPETQKLF